MRVFWVIILAVGLVGAWTTPAQARSVEGPCQMRDGICYRTLDEVVSPERHQFYMSNTPSSPLQILKHDIASGNTVRLPARPVEAQTRSVEEQAPMVLFGDEAVPGRPLALSVEDQPWLDPLYTTFVKIEAVFPDQPGGTISLCSGTMIGSHTVLTAGHCIFSHDYGGWATSVWVYPAMAGYHNTPFGESTAAGLVSTTWWAEDKNHDGDTGVIQLNENTGDLTGWPAMVWGDYGQPAAIDSGGYPSDEGYEGLFLFVDNGSVDVFGEFLICHSMHTVRGMSGGAGWVWDNPNQRDAVTAVNSYCEIDSGVCCMARYLDLNDQQRADSEAENAGNAPDHWTCDLGQFSDLDGCHCLCDVWDPDCQQAGQTVENCAAGERCIRPGICVCDPQCGAAECGPDNCGGSCGSCLPGSTCNNGSCSCVADCTGRQCGSDGCDGSCGSCPDGAACEGGTCVCQADCAGKVCGPDGCGGLCGQCPAGEGCVSGACACVPACGEGLCGDDGCGGSCGQCAGDQECVNGRCVCTFNCIDRECGSDGCGGSCGSCFSEEVCQNGQCISEGEADGSGCGCAAAGSQPSAGWVGLICFLFLLVRRRRG